MTIDITACVHSAWEEDGLVRYRLGWVLAMHLVGVLAYMVCIPESDLRQNRL